MTSLALVLRDHAQAFEYDAMTGTGRTLAEIARAPGGVAALVSLMRYLPPDSATYREMNPDDEVPAWCTAMKTNAILADLVDAYVAVHSNGRPKPYPRPGGGKRIGKGAIRVKDFERWWKSGA